MSDTPTSQPVQTPSSDSVQPQSTNTNEEDPTVTAFREGIASLITPHLESCSTDLSNVFAAQEKVLEELKRMELAISKLNQFKNIPKLAQYCDRVKNCRKRVTALTGLLGTIQQRITKFICRFFIAYSFLLFSLSRMREIQKLKLPQTLPQPNQQDNTDQPPAQPTQPPSQPADASASDQSPLPLPVGDSTESSSSTPQTLDTSNQPQQSPE